MPSSSLGHKMTKGEDGLSLEAEKALCLWELGWGEVTLHPVTWCHSLTVLSYPRPTSSADAQQQTLTVYTANFNNCVYPKFGKGRSLAPATGLGLVAARATPGKLSFSLGVMAPEDESSYWRLLVHCGHASHRRTLKTISSSRQPYLGEGILKVLCLEGCC